MQTPSGRLPLPHEQTSELKGMLPNARLPANLAGCYTKEGLKAFCFNEGWTGSENSVMILLSLLFETGNRTSSLRVGVLQVEVFLDVVNFGSRSQ